MAASYGASDELHPLQQAFIEHNALQCGYCTPGMLMAAASLWDKLVNPEEALPPITDQVLKHVLGRNACRCTGYGSVLRAFRSAIHAYETGEPLAPMQIESRAPLHIIGRPQPRPDIIDKVTGRARYTDDLSFPGMLHGATLRAAHPHARILAINTGAARALPGVHAVLTYRDVPGAKRHGLVERDWPVLCEDRVRYMGDAVAIVAADTPEIAAQALELIEVRYEPLPVVANPAQARRLDAPLIHPERADGNLLACAELNRGNLARGWAEADVIVEREYQTPIQDHLFMEPECNIGVPAGYDGEHALLTIYTGSQRPLADREQIAAVLDRPPEQVCVIGPSVGDSLGGKEDIMGQIHVALLAQATGRPVKILYHRVESLLAHPKRHAMTIRIKTGARRDGTLTAVEVELMADAGAYANLSGRLIARVVAHAAGPYSAPHVRVRGATYQTNNPPAGAFRGLGIGQATLAVEQNMDILAHELNLSPFELRRRNLGPANAARLRNCLDWVERRMSERKQETPAEHLRVGWGVAAAFRQGDTDRPEEPDTRVPLSVAAEWLQQQSGQPAGLVSTHQADADDLTSYGVQAAQVEVNTRSGQVRVLRLIAASDTGRVLNPQALLGQIEGGLMMGIGAALTEEYRVEEGIPQNSALGRLPDSAGAPDPRDGAARC